VPLITALEDKSWIVRRQAAEALEKYGTTAVPYLKQAFKKGGPDLKFWSIKLLSKLMGPDAVNEFIPILDSENEDMRYYALEALGEIKDPRIVPIVVKRLSDPSWIIRKLAAGILFDYGETIVENLVPLLNSDDEDCRYWVIKILGKMGDPGVDKLLEHLSKSDKRTKQFIISVLGEMDDERVIKALIQCLTDTNWPVRNQACEALERFESKAIEPLITYMVNNSCNSDLQFWGKKILNKNVRYIKGALGHLISMDERFKSFLMDSFPDLFEGQMLDILLTGDETSFEKARKIILKSPEKYINDLKNYINPSTEAQSLKRVMSLASEINSPELIPAFMSIMDSSSQEILFSAIDFLEKQKDDQTVQLFLDILENPSQSIRSRAVDYLSGHDIEEVRYKFIKILGNETDENQRKIIDYLGIVSDPVYLPGLLEFLENPSVSVCDFALKSILRLAERVPETIIETLDSLKGNALIRTMAALKQRVSSSGPESIKLIDKMGRLLNSDDPNTVRTVLAALEGQVPESLADKLENIFVKGGLSEKRVFLDSFSNNPRFRTPRFLARIIDTAEAGTALYEWCSERIVNFSAMELKKLREESGEKALDLISKIINNVIGLQTISPVAPVASGASGATGASSGPLPGPAPAGANTSAAPFGSSDPSGPAPEGSDSPDRAQQTGAGPCDEAALRQIDELVRRGDAQAVKELLARLGTDNTTLQFHAIDGLGKIGDPSALDHLKRFAQTASWALKSRIFEAFALFEPDLTADFLINQLKDENQMVRKKAARILGDMKSSVVIEKTLALFDDESFKNFDDLHQIYKLSGDIALRVLAPSLSSKNVSLRKNISAFFIEEGAYVTQYLVETIREDNVFHRKECTRILSEIGPPAIQFLEQVRQGKPTHVRRWILQTLRTIESSRKF
jgi:HEAT repeat protein